ncbi:MAG: transcriptional repressor [Chloroflexi bacterium]|nr:transcriptional repressor [Chloroflexota bacterium]MCH7652291.1 transcriptional repressor [Chloroflexota bacterium]MCH9009813.1 transcriptional repressor [Chloroflexota bacterium]
MNDVRPARHDLLAVLEDNGHRVTNPRRSVISLLEDKSDGFSAEEISHELPGVGRATVYRTIKLLLEAGVICKLVLPNGGSKYSLARVEHHHHTLCIKCGTVGEFRDTMIERLVRAIGEHISGEIVGHRMEFHVICEQCLAATVS